MRVLTFVVRVFDPRFVPMALSMLLCMPAFATDEGVNINAQTDQRPIDPTCKDGSPPRGIGKPVSPFSGKEFFEATDMVLPGVYPIEIGRIYDSQTTYQSPLGYGWAFTHDWRLYEYGDGTVVVRSACGNRHRYVPTGNNLVTDDTPGFRFDLRSVTGGGYVLSDRPGTQLFFDAEGRLTAIQNPQGNRHEFSYDSRGLLPLVGLSSQAVDLLLGEPQILAYTYRLTRIVERTADGALTGRFVDFSYDDASGRLMSVQAHDGRRVTYQHEMVTLEGTQERRTTGNLVKVIGLEGIEQTYGYSPFDGPHLLTSVQMGQGMETVLNDYDELGRVTQQTYGDSTLTFNYDPGPFAFDFPDDASDCDVLACRVIKRTIVTPGKPNQVATTVYKYRSDGYPVEKIDALGHRSVFGYEPGRPYQSRLQVFRNLGRPTSPQRELQKTIDSRFDLEGNLIEVKVQLDDGQVVTRSWTFEDNWMSSQQVVSSANPTQIFRTEWTFERAGIAPGEPGFDATAPISNVHAMRRRRADGSYDEMRFGYNRNGQLARTTPPAVSPDDGLQTVWTYTTAAQDGLVGMVKEAHLEIAGVPIPTLARQYTYDARSFPASVTDALGVKTQYQFDDLQRMIAATAEIDAPQQGSTSRVQTTRFTYRGPSVGLSDPSEAPPGYYLTQRERGPNGSPGHGMRGVYDPRGRMVRMERRNDAGGFHLWRLMEYDSDDNAIRTEDAIQRSSSFGYDLLKRMTSRVDGSGNQTLYDYDATGNRIREVDAENRTTRMQFDDLDRLIAVTQEAENLVTRMAYDAASNQISTEDPKGQVTAYAYDSRSRLSSVTQPLGVATPGDPTDFVVQYEYDDRDRMIRWINARGQVLKHTHATWAGAFGTQGVERIDHYPTVADADAGTNLQRSVRFTYDPRADFHTALDTEELTPVPAGADPAFEPAGRLYTFSYDGLRRMRKTIAHFVPGGGPGEGRTLTETYDIFKNRTGLELAGPAELLSHIWTFDAKDRLVAACFPEDQPCTPSTPTEQITYRPNDDLDLSTHGNGTTTRYTYEPQGRIYGITVTGPGSTPLALVHDYDPTQDVTSIRETQNGQELAGPGGATPGRRFGYDGVDRLTSATYPNGVGLPQRDDYDYDAAGNRDEATPQGTPLGSSTYDANNRVQTSPSGRTYVFDRDGNETQIVQAGSPRANLTFDVTNQLRRYDNLVTSSSSRYFYDPFGRRIRKIAGGITTWYVWDGDRLLAEYDASGSRTIRYAYAASFAPVEVAFRATDTSERIHSVHSDHLDTPRLLTDATGEESWRASYRAFGSAIVDADPDGDGQAVPDFNLRFPGQYFDGDTGLHYNRFRYYDPEIGRYNSSDPIGRRGGPNLYIYAGNSPLGAIDPEGLVPKAVEIERRDCDEGEESACRQSCEARGREFQDCFFFRTLKVIGLATDDQKTPVRDFVDGPVNCVCKPIPEDEEACEADRERSRQRQRQFRNLTIGVVATAIGLVVVDIAIGGPTGEGIGPAMVLLGGGGAAVMF